MPQFSSNPMPNLNIHPPLKLKNFIYMLVTLDFHLHPPVLFGESKRAACSTGVLDGQTKGPNVQGALTPSLKEAITACKSTM